ncbi:MarC family protein [uncultured Stenotrophomonas sp.]|uniref:MarC family protein n=1 Tax=uncultured Stenotrophomonas sp. TaxID=165438 RepID=UPI0028EF6619|nr:MarC family protein [uncultured Stenotrophomonas sp.]
MLLVLSALSTPPSPQYLLALADVFLLFFIMIGPIKAIGAYAAAAQGMESKQWTAVAWKVFAIAVVTTVAAGGLGGAVLHKWHIAPAVLQLAGGLVFLLVALQMVLAQYAAPAPTAAPTAAPADGPPPTARLAFPVTLPAYGIAALIVLVALSGSTERYLWIMGLAILVLVLDLLTMLYIRQIVKAVGQLPLQILAAVLGMLQVALALQLITGAVRTIITT